MRIFVQGWGARKSLPQAIDRYCKDNIFGATLRVGEKAISHGYHLSFENLMSMLPVRLISKTAIERTMKKAGEAGFVNTGGPKLLLHKTALLQKG
jgi:hypothetical protein